MKRFRRIYGAGPLHLVAALACFAVGGYAIARIFAVVGDPVRVLIWLGGGIVAHDLVLFPIYALVGVLVAAALTYAPAGLAMPALNHLRAPALLSGLLLLVWFPVVSGKAPRTWERATGLANDVYLGRWLAVTAALFAGSALLLAFRAPGLRKARGLPESDS